MSKSQKNKLIAKNTIILYVRMIALMCISLFTVRVTLNALGVEDYGIINAVGGLVALSSLITGSMAAATGRFITFALGEGDAGKLNEVFSATVNIHLLLAAALIILLELGGLWFLNTQMNIPADRLHAANWMFQSSVFVFALVITRTPYHACIVAHERMSAFAYMAILEGGFKLALATALYYSPTDRLILYAVMIFLFACFMQLIYFSYCKRHFAECSYHLSWNAKLGKSILSFSGWNLMGAGSAVLRDHGVNILLNIFCGPAVNAARGIAVQINTVVSSFVNNFLQAFNPQITKNFASGDREHSLFLVFTGSRISFLLLYFLSLPIILEAHAILSLWLGLVPAHTVNFVRLILVYNMTEAVSYTMVTLMLATGNIKDYQLVVGGCQMLNFPASYLLLRWGYAPEITIVVSITVALLCLSTRLYMLRSMVDLPVRRFLREVLCRDVLIVLASLPLPLLSVYLLDEGWTRVFISSSISVMFAALSAYFVGCSRTERNYLSQLIKRKVVHAYTKK